MNIAMTVCFFEYLLLWKHRKGKEERACFLYDEMLVDTDTNLGVMREKQQSSTDCPKPAFLA